MKKITYFFAILSIVFGLTSCGSKVVFFESNDIQGLNWDIKDVQTFSVDLPPSDQQLFDVKAFIRHASNCPVSSIPLHCTIVLPDGSIQEKDVEAVLKKDGKNIGEGLGDLWDVKTFILEDLKFEQGGKIQISIAHNMPNPKVPLILKVGAQIVKQTD